jgi:hypothetical protein
MSEFDTFIEMYETRVDEINEAFRKLIEESNKLYEVLKIYGRQIQLKQPEALKDLWRKALREQTEYEARLRKLNDLLARVKEQTLDEVAIEAALEEIQEQLDESQKYHDRDKPAITGKCSTRLER